MLGSNSALFAVPVDSLPACYADLKRPTGVRLPVLQHTNARGTMGRAIRIAKLGRPLQNGGDERS